MDGYEATRRIKALFAMDTKHPEIPVIITTANQVTGTPEAEAPWRKAGADAAISKPFGKEAIEKLLAEHCKVCRF